MVDDLAQTAAAAAAIRPKVSAFFDKRTFSVEYIVSDPEARVCAIIDPVLDFEEKSGSVSTKSADALLDHVHANGLSVAWILDTHPHADHLSAADYLKRRTRAPTAIGIAVTKVQALWKAIYNLSDDFRTDGSQWDRLFAAGDVFNIGRLPVRVMFSPGHTLASITYVVGDAAFVHDTLFMPDGGTARADFPGGDAATLWRSIQALLRLPDATRVFTGHDYLPGGREPRWESTIGAQKRENTHLREAHDEAAFVMLREGRDRTLPMPKLILQSLQVNLNAGRLPAPEVDGKRFLKLPIDAFPNAPWGD